MPLRKKQQASEAQRPRRIETTRYNPDYRTGLSSQQVQEHWLHGWTNRAVEPPSKTTGEIILQCLQSCCVWWALSVILRSFP